MKKFKFAMAALVVGFSMVSCSGDDDNGSSGSIEGKWIPVKEGVTANGQEQFFDYEHTEGCDQDYIEFLSGGAVNDVYYYGSSCTEEIDEGTWVKEGNTITATYGDESFTAEIITLTDTELRLGETQSMGGVQATYVTVYTKG
ncbi:hypothetical protein GN157_07515 [Flavobacterium rakeshii]|uniref:Lipocalin-like domain-containing protein n=1 Tax=Flavobacterium rakeshii TaxID=1038845 RepID=A0A6N8HD59_9FLAO|nr:lipocalin family protein [Flavobacterium rakeshii]MEE1896918.1 lipocalin family protein [Flavobacterium rakeshii]MUV03555.1 hypothetical protein [Flavobacterium rakeshii]